MSASVAVWVSRVYPRVCGGTGARPAPAPDPDGLSPRVRGNHGIFAVPAIPQGSIPACAGEPPYYPAGRRQEMVYPRVCGGTSGFAPAGHCAKGLSPRVRGNRKWHRYAPSVGGSIPACAGEPTIDPAAGGSPAVYPRVCGGTHRSTRFLPHRHGLSPRVRGNPHVRAGKRQTRRSIPACAGEPCPGSDM